MGTAEAGVEIVFGAGWVSVEEIGETCGGDTSEDGVAVSCRPHMPQNAPTALVPQTGQKFIRRNAALPTCRQFDIAIADVRRPSL